ncbi:MAG: hypothetical protein Q9219_007264 [cf. Caloplaca sp. 3 TL-2023]
MSYPSTSESKMSVDPTTQASSATVRGDAMKKAVRTQKAPPPLPFFSQAIVCQGMVYCSGSIGVSPVTKQMVQGGVGDHTAQALNNLSAVLEEAGSSLKNVVKCNVFLSDMTNFAAMNRVYDTFFEDPKPCRTCVAVSELPMKTDVEIECIAHLTKANGVQKPSLDSGYGGSEGLGLTIASTTTRKSPTKESVRKHRRLHSPDKSNTFTRLRTQPPRMPSSSSPPLIEPIDELALTLDHFSSSLNHDSLPALASFLASLPPHPATDTAYKARYLALRSYAWDWAQKTFPPSTLPQNDPPLNLIHLAATSPELMEYINATTSLPQSETWENFIWTKRAEIVYGILGKVLEMHIFGEELFGANEAQKKALRMKDWELVDSDGFSRQTARTSLLRRLLPPATTSPLPLPPLLLPSLHTLSTKLTTLLSPLSPTTPIDPPTLLPLLLHASLLHISIRIYPSLSLLQNQNQSHKTIHHFLPSLAPSSPFDPEDAHAVNAKSVAETIRQRHIRAAVRKGKLRKVVRGSGWPGLVIFRGVDEGRRRGVATKTLARGDVFVGFEVLGDGKEKEKRSLSLREEVWKRYLEGEEEKERERRATGWMGGLAATVGRRVWGS